MECHHDDYELVIHSTGEVKKMENIDWDQMMEWMVAANVEKHRCIYENDDIIDSEDMDNRALAIFSFLENQKGRNKSAEKYLLKAIANGLSARRLKMFLIDKDLTEKTISNLHEMKKFD